MHNQNAESSSDDSIIEDCRRKTKSLINFSVENDTANFQKFKSFPSLSIKKNGFMKTVVTFINVSEIT